MVTTAKVDECLDAGNLSAALEEAVRVVKAHPSDLGARTLYFTLLSFAGEWERAEKALDFIGHQDATILIGVQQYQQVLRAERDRVRLFSQGLQPFFFAEPPHYVDLHLRAVNCLRANQLAEAEALLAQATAARPNIAGKLGETPFQSFRDYDDVLAPVLEVFWQGNYSWLPWEHISRIEMNAPATLRDLLWISARIDTNLPEVGSLTGAVLPALYANSCQHADDQVRLGRSTVWQATGENIYLGAGLRTFLIDDEDKAVLAIREIEINPGATASHD